MKRPASERWLWIVADDLSGAADCAAAFAPACGPVVVALGEVAPVSGNVAMDTDSRALDAAAATAAVACAFACIPRGSSGAALVYKKIDSTLRGHVGAELRAALDAAPQFAGAVIAPSFPEQGRTLRDGKLCVHGRPAEEPAGDLMGQLAAAGLRPALLRQSMANPARVRQQIEQAFAAGAWAVVVDAANTTNSRTWPWRWLPGRRRLGCWPARPGWPEPWLGISRRLTARRPRACPAARCWRWWAASRRRPRRRCGNWRHPGRPR